MPTSFKHITAEDRTKIATLLDEQKTNSYIAKRLKLHRSTIGREIKRNQINPRPNNQPPPERPRILDTDCRHFRGSGRAKDKYEAMEKYNKQLREFRNSNKFYNSKVANKTTKDRRTLASQKRIRIAESSESWIEKYVLENLTQNQWSPEQISGSLKKNHSISISPQTIYDYIYNSTDKKNLVKHLRRGGNNYRRKHGTHARAKARQASLPPIELRPEIVQERTRLGDLEGDTVVGLDKKDRILTHVDRASGECSLSLILGYDADKIEQATRQSVRRAAVPVKTITYDRGTEFAQYERLQRKAKVDVYFANAYHSWERGTNENLNGLARQYFPKRSDFKSITQRQLKIVENKLNNRPRKRYNYRTPIQQREHLLAVAMSGVVAVRDGM
jgi:transposase, IS30 family